MPSPSKPRRLDQLLASLGHGSRREVRELIDCGLVTLGGTVLHDEGRKITPDELDAVQVEGQPLEAVDGLLVMLHKPLGHVCSHTENEGPSIYKLLPERWLKRNPAVTSVGRLDKDTSGLILVTDRGELVQRWTSPKSVVEKVYEAEVDHPLQESLADIFASGTLLLRGEDRPCLPAKLEITGERTARVILTEGRYHQVRRMFASQGWHVEKLHRSQFGPCTLGDLEAGAWRHLPLPGLQAAKLTASDR